MAAIILAGDLCPIGADQPLFAKGDTESLFHELLLDFEEADLVVANLECPLVERASPIVKTGPTFGVPGDCINAIQAAGIDVLNLANNHILDHGPAGLANTLAVCERAGVASIGAGAHLAAARQLFVRKVGNVRVGILAMAEREFSIATPRTPGANPLDVIDFVRNVRQNRNRFDYLILLLHGGAEFQVPSPGLRDSCRFLVEMGANVVIVQHPHVLGGCEEYLGGHIIYGQGALVMDEAIYRSRRSFHEGFLVKLSIADDFTSKVAVIPFEQSNPVPGARKLTGERERVFRRHLEHRSAAIQDEAVIEAEWLEFCRQAKNAYLSSLLGHNRLFRKLNRGGLVTKLLYGKKALLRAGNTALCETHREALNNIFNRLL